MDDIRPIAVVNSKAAQRDLDEIKMRHTDILTGMKEQQMLIKQNTQQTQQREDQRLDMDRDYELKRLTALT